MTACNPVNSFSLVTKLHGMFAKLTTFNRASSSVHPHFSAFSRPAFCSFAIRRSCILNADWSVLVYTMLKQVVFKTDVTLAILSRNFGPQLYRATKSQAWHGVSCNSWTVAQLLFRIEQCSNLFCATLSPECCKRWLVNYCFYYKVAVCDMHSCILQLCREIKLRDKIARYNCMCDIGITLCYNFCGTGDAQNARTENTKLQNAGREKKLESEGELMKMRDWMWSILREDVCNVD